MRITILSKNISIGKGFEAFVIQKVGQLDRLLKGGIGLVKVEVGKETKHHKTGPIFFAEINASLDSKLLRVEATHIDLQSAVIQAREEMERQVKKFKDKKKDLARKHRE